MPEINDQYMIPSFSTPFDYSGARGRSSGLLGDYSSFLAGQEKYPQMYDRLAGQYQLPQMQEAYQMGSERLAGLSSQIMGMPDQIKGTTRDSMVTESQKQGMVQAGQAPLTQEAGVLGGQMEQLGSQMGMANEGINRAMSMQMAQQDRELAPYEMGISEEQRLTAMEHSGWSTENSQELSRLQSNQQAGITLSEGEKNRQHQLEVQKEQYKLQLENYKSSAEFDKFTMGEGLGALWDSLGF